MSSENDKSASQLKTELGSMQKMFQQLTEESKEESYDVRRAYMLKAQIIQLERQCMLLSEALSSRANVMHGIENEIIDLTGEFQQLLAHQSTGSTVPIARKSLVSHIQKLLKLKGNLRKQSVANNVENLSIPQLSGWKFANSRPLTCLDVCDGDIKHINLQQVAKLELNLSKLYKQLVSYQTMLQANFPTNSQNTSTNFPEKYLYSKAFQDVTDQTEACIEKLDGCCTDLLSVSMLHPSAPWTVIQKPEKFGKFHPQEILQSLPPTVQRKAEVRSTVNSMCKVHSYFMHMHRMKMKEVQVQVEHSAACQQIQTHYMNCLLKGVVDAYNECEKSLQTKICKPLKEVVEKWFEMKDSQSDDALRKFLTSFKQNEDMLKDFAMVDTGSQSHGCVALQELGTELKTALHQLKVKCAAECEMLKESQCKFKQENEEQISDMMKNLSTGQTPP